MRFSGLGRRCAAVLLLGLVLPPWYLLLARRAAGPAAEQTLRLGNLYVVNLWVSSALLAAASLLLGSLVRPRFFAALSSRAGAWLLRPTSTRFGTALGVLAASISLGVNVRVLDGKPALLDGVAQLVQGRYVAGGRLAGPLLEDPEFWQFQFMVLTDGGWVSQYPPGFPFLLAAGEWFGLAWLMGPLTLGCAILLTSLVAERLFPADRTVARVGAALAAFSPMLAFHAAAYMNHVLSLLLTVVAVFASLRAADGSWRWSLLSGAAVGGMVATRPYTGLVLGLFATIVVWLGAPGSRRLAPSEWVRRLAGAFAGAAPFVGGVLLYNRRFFGAPTRFGYEAAEGPGHRLGFHVDPWGSPYGPLEAIGYTSADLQGLSVEMLQAPVPSVVLIALYLLLSRSVCRGAALAAAWALLPVAAHAFYWHHDLFMGPRLLYEALPAWCLLLAAAALASVRALPEEGRPFSRRRLVTRGGLGGAFILALIVAVTYGGPRKLASYRSVAERAGMTVAAPTVERASLVFVHGSWEDRLAARLAAAGMRVDSIRSALAHNSTCRLELYLEGLERGTPALGAAGAGPTELAFQDTGGPRPRELRMPSGSVIRAYEDEVLDPLCERQAASDFHGVVGLPPLLWQGDLPGLGSGGAMFVRDLGPERNLRLIERFPNREAGVLIRRDGEIRLISYDGGMRELWTAGDPPT